MLREGDLQVRTISRTSSHQPAAFCDAKHGDGEGRVEDDGRGLLSAHLSR